MNEQSLETKCPVCQHKLSDVLDEKALEEMVIYCPNCNVKINLETFNTTTGSAIVGHISSVVINEHIAMMKDKDWKKNRGLV